MNEKPVLYFDGKCRLCNVWLGFLRSNDKKKRIEYIPLQSEKGKMIQASLRSEFSNPDTVVFEKDGKIYIRSEAVIYSLKEIGGIWRVAIILKIFPEKCRNKIYDAIARNRYKFFGEMNSCNLT